MPKAHKNAVFAHIVLLPFFISENTSHSCFRYIFLNTPSSCSWLIWLSFSNDSSDNVCEFITYDKNFLYETHIEVNIISRIHKVNTSNII